MIKFPEDVGKKAVWIEEVKGLVRVGEEVDWQSGEQEAFLRVYPASAKLVDASAAIEKKVEDEEEVSPVEPPGLAAARAGNMGAAARAVRGEGTSTPTTPTSKKKKGQQASTKEVG